MWMYIGIALPAALVLFWMAQLVRPSINTLLWLHQQGEYKATFLNVYLWALPRSFSGKQQLILWKDSSGRVESMFDVDPSDDRWS